MDSRSEHCLSFSELLDVLNGGKDLPLACLSEALLLLCSLALDHLLHFRDPLVRIKRDKRIANLTIATEATKVGRSVELWLLNGEHLVSVLGLG